MINEYKDYRLAIKIDVKKELNVSKKNNKINFEKTFLELEELVNQMEKGDLSLEESLKCFERGMNLTKDCQQALHQAEQKVKILLEKNSLENFKSDNND